MRRLEKSAPTLTVTNAFAFDNGDGNGFMLRSRYNFGVGNLYSILFDRYIRCERTIPTHAFRANRV